ncbi:putative cytochrome P450 [Talaromyces proteolyticus]|uniref:Cytochrome P450 n=1 Tax=Talaromyces proteolyticus TaxID=1131652 RepID=A0AAD4PZW5_9EURO|nr:putative cytochrome P450 [Talaromyces proteolyticus]KAH8703443.1 putative cytochrome P450 [Talaromyces proteolyticus]
MTESPKLWPLNMTPIMTSLSLALVFIVSYACFLAIYRLYFHPLAHFPGSKLAAVTNFYEFYYDVIKRGMFVWEIKRMHDLYGPIVRINPHEVHILDTEFYDTIYAPASKQKRDKYAKWVVFLGVPTGVFATCPHDHHRIRRNALNPFFSKRSIYQIEGLMQEKIEYLCSRFEEASLSKSIVRLDAALMALTNDIIMHYCYGESYHYLEEADFKVSFKEMLMSAVSAGGFVRHFPWVVPIVKAIPIQVLRLLSEKAVALLEWEQIIERKVGKLIQQRKAGKDGSENSVFQLLLDSDLPKEEKSRQRLVDEGKSLMGAGSETTSWTITLIIFYLLQNRHMMRKLREELHDMPHDGPVWRYLEQKSYLSAVVSEGIRVNHGALGRLPRIAHEPIQYKNWAIPPGTPFSSTNYWVHMDSTVFSEPEKFHPERWLKAEKEGFPLQRYLVSFSKGSRQCVGINLAYAEIYLVVAAIVTRFDLELYETTVDDVLPAREFFIPRPKAGSKGVMVKVKAHRL